MEVLYLEIKYWGHVLGVSWLLWEISIEQILISFKSEVKTDAAVAFFF